MATRRSSSSGPPGAAPGGEGGGAPPPGGTIRFRQVVRELGRRLLVLERERLARIADLEYRRKRVYREMRRVAIDPVSMQRAVRSLVEMDHRGTQSDRLAAIYADAIENEEGDW